MQSLLKTTAASTVLAAALSLFSFSLVAQEPTPGDADPPDAASEPDANDESSAEDETTAGPAPIGEPTPNNAIAAEDWAASEEAMVADTQTEIGAEGGTLETESDVTNLFDGEADGSEEVESAERGGGEPDTGDRLAAAIASTEGAAADIQVAAARLPDIVDCIDAIVTKVEGLPIEEPVTELTSLAASANTLVWSEATQALPADLSAALGEIEAILREVREGGVVENANGTLQSARAAADTLPGLAERAGVLLDQAGATIEGFQESSSIVREA